MTVCARKHRQREAPSDYGVSILRTGRLDVPNEAGEPSLGLGVKAALVPRRFAALTPAALRLRCQYRQRVAAVSPTRPA